MRRYIIIFVIILLVAMTFGAATNPTYEDYKNWYKDQAQEGFIEYKSGKETTELEKSIMNFMVEMIADTSVIREDHKIYSLYTIESDDYHYRVLGMFNNFYVLEDEKQK